jgi:DNA adenine methylase
MIKSPLRYPGGKSRGVKFISEFIPDYNEFREVFFGGGSLSFYYSQQKPDKNYLASDLNYELHCFWSQLKDNGVILINNIQNIYNEYKNSKFGEDTYLRGKELFAFMVNRRESELTELERATDFFILNRITFSGVVDSGGYSQGSFDGRFTQSSIERLKTTMEIISRIDFYCDDYSTLVNKEGENVFIFLDPPYYSATKSKLYGKNGILHTQFDHKLLFETLSNSNHKWLITYDNCDYIRELYKDYFLKEWSLQYGMTNRNNATSRKGNELLISNYDFNNLLK